MFMHYQGGPATVYLNIDTRVLDGQHVTVSRLPSREAQALAAPPPIITWRARLVAIATSACELVLLLSTALLV